MNQTNIETTKQHSGQQQQTSLVVANCWFFGEWVIYTTKNQVINCTNIYWEKLIKFKSWISLYYLHFTRKFRCFTITFVLPQQIHHGGSSTILSRPNTVVWDIRLINMWNDFLIWHIMWQYYWPIGKGNRQMIRHCMSWCNWPIIWPEYSSNVGMKLDVVRQGWVKVVKSVDGKFIEFLGTHVTVSTTFRTIAQSLVLTARSTPYSQLVQASRPTVAARS